MRAHLRTAIALAGVAVALAACSGEDAPEGVAPMVVYYSDSLGVQSIDATEEALEGRVELVHRGIGGTAICDWLAAMERDVAQFSPDLVVAGFVGNDLTSCVSQAGDPTADQVVARYTEDARRAEEIITGADVPLVWLLAPAMVDDPSHPQPRIEDAYREGAAADPLVEVADPGRVLEDDEGRGVTHLPCAPDETESMGCGPDGMIRVRQLDGAHLCSGGDGTSCEGYAAGAHRYGTAVAEAILDHLPVEDDSSS